ncbi:SRPBCC family protein [Rhodoblastus acidophilus]|uniref:SRPBCC family protein n=1 Tax=Candidatus Rhodoblastus alkanivorans TaxID=2954117 RepID=A0ABS9Z6A7_9HYPH|nr:SRPBCC family protein [Candidatus Rhodoblastus alkanivorans]MCI4678407.1 SRPBCC family protein [Candidatus Rhodoblastus alkanivorans]MCI4682920.1 SRPBCC family protein [Candidatus Rhodoblastus alkanivorans]MDI4640230.1 SRPBCC family protein [Rhodoblastus acidophilus]
MPSFRTSHVVNHTPQQMFDLVADVEAYPQFVPLCQALRVKRRFSGADGAEVVLAEMEVGYKAIRERFTSRVTLNRAARRIDVEYVDGPFSHLENIWRFVDADEGKCRIEFYIAYEFRSRMLAALMGSMFDAAFRKFAFAFETRADEVFRPA